MESRFRSRLLATLLATIAVGALLAPTGGALAQAHGDHGHATPAVDVPLYDNLGRHHREIATDVDAAQAYFDQGLRLQYAFNHAEAIRSYEEALRHDPECAMCWWGVGLASGPNINAPMTPDAGRAAFAALEHARGLAADGPEKERRLIGALSRRYAADPEAERAPLDRAYAEAMAELAGAYPDDADVLTLYGASLMNLNPWNYWSGDYDAREPNDGTPELLMALTAAVRLQPENPGACHYFIHAVEAAYPERAVECADRLAALMPGAGHIVHMPGHIYIRVGRYADAVRANEHAVHADETYIADQAPIGLYPSAYYPHNYHFMWFAASMAGMSDKAMQAATTVAPKVPIEIAREVHWIQSVRVLPQLTAITFGQWDAALAAPAPPAELVVATGMHRYARGVAAAAKGLAADAAGELDAVRELASRVRAADPEASVPSPATTLLDIAEHMLAGEIALRADRPDEAVDHFTAAAAIEDEILYEEPPLWFFPVRHALGRALLDAGRPADAEAAYRADLSRFRENGWSLHGLARALEAQGREQDAAAAWARFREAWRDSDIALEASHF